MNREIVSGEWMRAVQTLQAAELPAREGFHEDAVARSCYAILHAAKAVLLVHDIAAESHAGVRRLFGKHLVLSGAIERKWARYPGESLDDRLAADYDVGVSFSYDESQRECREAKEFLGRMQRYLNTNGLTDNELGMEAGDG